MIMKGINRSNCCYIFDLIFDYIQRTNRHVIIIIINKESERERERMTSFSWLNGVDDEKLY